MQRLTTCSLLTATLIASSPLSADEIGEQATRATTQPSATSVLRASGNLSAGTARFAAESVRVAASVAVMPVVGAVVLANSVEQGVAIATKPLRVSDEAISAAPARAQAPKPADTAR